MKYSLLFLLCFPLLSLASVGDRLVDYVNCLGQCDQLFECNYPLSDAYRQEFEGQPRYKQEDFRQFQAGWIGRNVLLWDCILDCKYACTQMCTINRIKEGYPIEQYYGKWPFKRIFGMTEFFAVICLLANLWANYTNIRRVKFEYSKSKRTTGLEEYSVMYKQYLLLLYVSVIGWGFSSIFHIRDLPFTETCDYFGAIAIIMCNFNSIITRRFKLYKKSNNLIRGIFQLFLVVIYLIHCSILLRQWDYGYNIKFTSFFGLFSMIMWCYHLIQVNKDYQKRYQIISNSIQLLPYETRLLAKINRLGFWSKSNYIALIPIGLNLFLVAGLFMEVLDFSPIFGIIDAHSLWHLLTIIPSLLWYDWNIWDVEFEKFLNKV